MAPGPQFNLDHDVTYGTVDQITPLVQRVTCENPSKFTFTGTGTYIVGDEEVAIIDPGPPEDAHVDALLAAIDGRTVTHLLITHTHPDHSPAAATVTSSKALASASKPYTHQATFRTIYVLHYAKNNRCSAATT